MRPWLPLVGLASACWLTRSRRLPHNTVARRAYPHSLTNGYLFRQFGFTEIVYELAVLFLSKHPSADGLVRLST